MSDFSHLSHIFPLAVGIQGESECVDLTRRVGRPAWSPPWELLLLLCCVLECSGSGWISNPSQWLCCLWVRERGREEKEKNNVCVAHLRAPRVQPELVCPAPWTVSWGWGRGLVCTVYLLCLSLGFSSLCRPTLSHFMSRLFWPLKLH